MVLESSTAFPFMPICADMKILLIPYWKNSWQVYYNDLL